LTACAGDEKSLEGCISLLIRKRESSFGFSRPKRGGGKGDCEGNAIREIGLEKSGRRKKGRSIFARTLRRPWREGMYHGGERSAREGVGEKFA